MEIPGKYEIELNSYVDNHVGEMAASTKSRHFIAVFAARA
jgi:hypothetical protein